MANELDMTPDQNGEDQSGSAPGIPFAQDMISESLRKARLSINGTEIRNDISANLDHLLRATKAIIITNNEIWRRCKDNVSVESFRQPDLTMERVIYQKVTVATSYKSLDFSTVAEFSTKNFGKPPSIPTELTSIIVCRQQSDGLFPDYDTFFEMALLLNKESLSYFIAKLKEHLECFQVFLGEIDSWLMESHTIGQFLGAAFQEDVETPTKKECTTSCGASSTCHVPHNNMCLCVNCKEPYQSHQRVISGYHRCSNGRQGSFVTFIPRPRNLKSYPVTGEHKDTFLMDDVGRTRLLAFLSFAKLF